MVRNYLIDLAYRNICFLKFLETSLDNWTSVKRENPNEKISELQKLFRQKNDENLINYQSEEKLGGQYSADTIAIKTEKIRDWAKTLNINMEKEFNAEEINAFIDKTLYPALFPKLNSLKQEKNQILQLVFPQLINNLFASFDLFKSIKTNLYNNLKKEMDNYSSLLLESNRKEEALNNEINKNKKEFKNEKTKYENKIKLMEEEIKKLEEEISSKNNYSQNNIDEIITKYNELNSVNENLLIINESFSSEILGLKEENIWLKERMEAFEKELKIEREKRKKLGNDLINIIEANNKQMVEQMRKVFNTEEQK